MPYRSQSPITPESIWSSRFNRAIKSFAVVIWISSLPSAVWSTAGNTASSPNSSSSEWTFSSSARNTSFSVPSAGGESGDSWIWSISKLGGPGSSPSAFSGDTDRGNVSFKTSALSNDPFAETEAAWAGTKLDSRHATRNVAILVFHIVSPPLNYI